jgi:hypothetical protein
MTALNAALRSGQGEAATEGGAPPPAPGMTLEGVTRDPAVIFRSAFPENADGDLARAIYAAASGYVQAFDHRQETLKDDLDSWLDVPTEKLSDAYKSLQQHVAAIAGRAKSRLDQLGYVTPEGAVLPPLSVTPEVAGWFGELAAAARIDALFPDMQNEQQPQNELEL